MASARIKKEDIGYGYESDFPKALRKLLEGKTQEELAKFCGVSRQSIAQWKDGKTKPDIYYLTHIAKFFGVSTDYLLGLSTERTTDAELRGVCDYIGLSEGGVRLLHKTKENTLSNIIVNGVVDALLADFESDAMEGHPVLTSISLFMNVNTSESFVDNQLAIFPSGEILPVDGSVEPFKSVLEEYALTTDSPIFKRAMRRNGISIVQRSEFDGIYMIEVQKSLKSLKSRSIDITKRKGCN